MAKHEVVIHENTGATKETAPFLGSYIAKETVRAAGFADTVGKYAGMSSVQALAILDGSFDVLEQLERESPVRIHTDLGTILVIITGSLDTSDAAFDRERNKLELALRIDDAIKNTLADVVPYIAQDDSLTKLRVDNVMDLENPKPYNVIHGQGVFRVAGFNMVLDDEGATAYLQNKAGTTFALTIDQVVSKQLFKAHSTQLLEAGDYKLVVKSRAGDAEGPLQTSFRNVKYLHIVPPAPPARVTKVESPNGGVGKLKNGDGAFLYGENIETAKRIDMRYTDSSGETQTLPTDAGDYDPDYGFFDIGEIHCDDVNAEKPVFLDLYTEDGKLLCSSGELEWLE